MESDDVVVAVTGEALFANTYYNARVATAEGKGRVTGIGIFLLGHVPRQRFEIS